MPLNIVTDPNPLRMDDGGAIRVGKCRVLLEVVISEFEQGKSPEAIVHSYSTLDLADVYHVLAFYLRHRQEVTEYLREVDENAEKIRALIEARQPDSQAFREKLRQRWADREQSHAPSADR